MVGVVLTIFVGFSIIISVIRFIPVLFSGNLFQFFKTGVYSSRSMYDPQDPLDPINYDRFYGDNGYYSNTRHR